MRRMEFNDVMTFYSETVIGSAKGFRPRGLERSRASALNEANRVLAEKFLQSFEGYWQVRSELHQIIRGEPMTSDVGVFLRLVRTQCPINAPCFAFSDVSGAVVTIDPIPVPKRLYARLKRKWQRSGKTLPFDFPFRAWKCPEGHWWCYEEDLLRFLER